MGWKFQIDSHTCPPRLLKPKVRVSRENQATLVIKDVIMDDGGIYICDLWFRNRVHRLTNTTKLIVAELPEFTRAPINTTVNQGHDVILHCQATANPPIRSISWTRENNEAIKPGFNQLTNGTLIIPNAVRSDAGSYICTAKNVFNHKLHTVTIRAYVSVKFPPGQPQVNVTNIKASSATISWIKPLYNGGSPITGYKLMIHSKEYEFNDRALKEYTVSSLTKDTQYVVRVYARNDVGYSKAASVYFRTKKQGPPAQPIVVSVIVNQTSVALTWSRPEENGGEITGFSIYKKVDAYSWTKIVQISGTPLTYSVKNLEPGKTYRFIVTATNMFGESVKDDSKAKIVSILDVTTKLPDSGRTTASTMKQPECEGSSSKSSAQKNLQVAMIAVGVCVCLLVISLIFNILSVVYFYRVKKKTKKTTETTSDNVEMAASAAAPPPYANVHQTNAEYEPVRQTNNIPSTEDSPYEIPGNQHTSEDHYQQLNPETMQHDPKVQYEPLRTQHVNTDQRNDTYEPLRNRPTEYQSLQKYSNA